MDGDEDDDEEIVRFSSSVIEWIQRPLQQGENSCFPPGMVTLRENMGLFDSPSQVPYPTLPYPTLPYPTLPFPSLPFPTLPYPTLFYPTLPYPTLPYPTLPYPTLPYPTLP